MKMLSVDLWERILATYDAGEGSREEVAHRFRISLGMVKKLIQQRRRTGDLAPRHHFSGCQPKMLERHRQHLQRLLHKQPDLTLGELRAATRLKCTLPAIHYVLADMDLTDKKTLRASEQDREDIAAEREEWRRKLDGVKAGKLVFLDESAAKTNMTRGFVKISV